MQDWITVFESYLNSGVHTNAVEGDEPDIRQAAEAAGLEYAVIELHGITDRTGFLAAVACAMHFPKYFGMNWDALHDCLTDLSWRPAAGYVLFFAGFSAFSDSSPVDAGTAVRILSTSAIFWRENEVPFHAVLSTGDCPATQASA